MTGQGYAFVGVLIFVLSMRWLIDWITERRFYNDYNGHIDELSIIECDDDNTDVEYKTPYEGCITVFIDRGRCVDIPDVSGGNNMRSDSGTGDS